MLRHGVEVYQFAVSGGTEAEPPSRSRLSGGVAATVAAIRRELYASMVSSMATPDPSLIRAFAQIDGYAALGPNWDGEDALPVSPESVSRTKRVLRLIRDKAGLASIPFYRPSIAPNPDGGLELSWEVGPRWVLLVIQPGESGVRCVTQEDGSPPVRQVDSIGDAAERVLWAMSSHL